ncbi:MAG: hypothetical protein H0X45_06575, partial [Planctomycetes bacterium]|nr:hypothetical protein [Planctomycetota bacterium]
IEKLPLHHWRPGARALVVGARDGVAFDGVDERGSFTRALTPELVAEAARKARVDAIAAWWSESLRQGEELSALSEVATILHLPLIIGTSGHGEGEALARALPSAAAWVLFATAAHGPQAAAILAGGRHVEVVLGLDDDAIPVLDYARAACIHLVPRRAAAAPEDLELWRDHARAALPEGVAIHDDRSPHSDCPCGARLIWRAGGRSRLDSLDPVSGRCRACARDAAIVLG